MAPTTTRTSYTNEFKIKVAKRGKEIGYRPAGKEYNVSDKNVRRWAKELNIISDAPMNRRIARTPRYRAMFPDLEAEVSAFINEKRNNDDGFPFSRANICNEALRIARERFGLSEFIASPGWYQRFMRRMGYTIQELNSREPLGNQPTSPADQDSITATENSDPAAFEHGQVSPPAMEPLGNQPTSPADQDSIRATENSDPAAFEHGQVEGSPSPEDPESFQEEAMKTGDIVEMLDQFAAERSPAATDHGQVSPPDMVSESVACNIPSTAEVPEAIPFQEWTWRSSEVSDLLSVPMNNEQLEDLDFSFDTAKFDEMPWHSAYCALQKKKK